MASSNDKTQLLYDINRKVKHVEDCFECFQEDFKNITSVGNNIQVRLGDHCIDSIVPFEGMIDRFLDILNTFDRHLKSTLDAWLQIELYVAGKCHSPWELLNLIVRNMSKYLLKWVKTMLYPSQRGAIWMVHLEVWRALMMRL